MKMSMTGQMRLEQRMKLAPRMIQSMEVLQLPLLALQEKIETELSSNPVLEVAEEETEDRTVSENNIAEDPNAETIEQKELIVDEENSGAEDFERLDSIQDDFNEYFDQAPPMPSYKAREGSDKKLEALQNTADTSLSLHEYLTDQWALVETDDKTRRAGALIIDYIDEKGFLSVRLEQLHNKDKHDFGIEHLQQAILLVQKLDPTGVGACDLKECLLIQMEQFPEDMSFEIKLISEHWKELLDNRLPQIAKKMKCSVDQLYLAIRRMSKLDTSPGLQIGRNENHPITADVIVRSNADGSGYAISLANTSMPNLQINDFYTTMVKDRNVNVETRDFLQKNIHSAQWLMDAIAQRRSTLLKVSTVIVEFQKDFFEKGKLFLKPLPMAKVADVVGIHIATVSRAVSGKYVQCPQGILPLRGFFSGGTKDTDGNLHSWDAIKEQLQQIVDAEDKSKPLNDDEIRDKLIESGLEKIARRTVAKYRKLLNIPAGRFRKKY
ncbi:MAG: RNA polymerase factor sigma-54 [Planctomycetes bacterium]|nr:RNA polymerase factor sigma-54 [Planctomycetota bacterium]